MFVGGKCEVLVIENVLGDNETDAEYHNRILNQIMHHFMDYKECLYEEFITFMITEFKTRLKNKYSNDYIHKPIWVNMVDNEIDDLKDAFLKRIQNGGLVLRHVKRQLRERKHHMNLEFNELIHHL